MPENIGPEYYNDLKKTSAEGGLFKLYESEKDPNLVIKTHKYDESIPEVVLREQAQDMQEFYNATHHTKLSEIVPRSQVVVGKNEHGKASFSVIMEKIEGRKINRKQLTEPDKMRLIEAVKTFVDSYIQSYNGKSGYTLEFELPENYMFGTKASNPSAESQLYFIDTFPVYKIPISDVLLKLDDFSEYTGIPREQVEPIIDTLKKFEAKE